MQRERDMQNVKVSVCLRSEPRRRHVHERAHEEHQVHREGEAASVHGPLDDQRQQRAVARMQDLIASPYRTHLFKDLDKEVYLGSG